ncbi:MAG: DNA polymerase IV [Actinobacteria bacterium]|nr:DNA polymerase IV [Actinomycetota bacterium]
MERTILLADMNSFFASVHQALDPRLKNRAVIVGGDQEKRHGIVLAASYEAKDRGIKTGMPVWEARQACPEAIFVPPRHHFYVHFSSRILKIMGDFTPLVEPFSIDEAFMDITGCEGLFGSPVTTAQLLKDRILREVDIPCSVGIGPNKLLAKMAAGLQKPDGLTFLRQEDVKKRLWPLPVRKLFGIGSRYERHLKYFNIHTIGDLAVFPREILKKRFGIMGEVMWWSANGADHSPVDPHSLEGSKSVGHQITLPRDFRRRDEIAVVILDLSDLVARRARQGGYTGRTVSLVLKDTSFNWLGRSRTLNACTDLPEDLYQAGLWLLDRHWQGYPVRMVGLSLSGLTRDSAVQCDVFGWSEKLRRLAGACDRIRTRFGEKVIKRGSSLTPSGVVYE